MYAGDIKETVENERKEINDRKEREKLEKERKEAGVQIPVNKTKSYRQRQPSSVMDTPGKTA